MGACTVGQVQAMGVIREARKVIRTARYKSNNDEAKKIRASLEQSEQKLVDAVSKERKHRRKAILYYTAGQVEQKLNDIENAKIYLKLPYDTVLYYQSIYKLYGYMVKCDSVEVAAKPNGRYKFRSKARRRLLANRGNLLNGARFYLKKRDYPEAYKLLDVYLASAGYPMLERDHLSFTDTLYQRASYWAVVSAFHAREYEGVIRHFPEAMKFGRNREYLQEYLCKSYSTLKDTAAWEREMKTGIATYPSHDYFFTNLVGYWGMTRRFDTIIQYADRMIRKDPDKLLFHYARALAASHLHRYEDCIASCDRVLALDSMHLDANYEKGFACCALASKAENELLDVPLKSTRYQTLKQQITEAYANARGPLEKVRQLAPQDTSRWVLLLYDVYLNLNMGSEFAEMEQILNKLPQNQEKEAGSKVSPEGVLVEEEEFNTLKK